MCLPFKRTAADLADSITYGYVEQDRNRIYVFTLLTVKAIHLEAVESQSNLEFPKAFRRI